MKKGRHFFTSFLIVLIIFLVSNFLQISGKFTQPYENIEVVDGDTLKLAEGTKVRLLGINAPERGEFLYDKSKSFLESLIRGKKVFFEKDIVEKDEYGRLLRFAFTDEGNLNIILVRNGYAHTFDLQKISKYKDELLSAEKNAIENELGIWKKSKYWQCIKLKELKHIGEEYIEFENVCNFSINLEKWSIDDESHNRFIFPKFLLSPQKSVRVYTTKKDKFSFRKKYPIFNREGDSIFVRDENGLLVLFYRY